MKGEIEMIVGIIVAIVAVDLIFYAMMLNSVALLLGAIGLFTLGVYVTKNGYDR